MSAPSAKKPSSIRTTVDLPEALFRQAKVHAAVKGVTLKELITVGLERILESSPGKSASSSGRLKEESPSFPPPTQASSD